MSQHEEEACLGYLAVVLQQDVYAEGRCDRLETGGDDELQAHQGRPTKPNATEKLMRNPLPGSIPDQARTSGAMVTARYTSTRNVA